jgi:molybdate transport system regulatory protein
MNMSYRRSWVLVDELNQMFKAPVVATQHGGAKGGGAALTDFGRDLVARYRAAEREATEAVGGHLSFLRDALR